MRMSKNVERILDIIDERIYINTEFIVECLERKMSEPTDAETIRIMQERNETLRHVKDLIELECVQA